jgi:hypothetical protein
MSAVLAAEPEIATMSAAKKSAPRLINVNRVFIYSLPFVHDCTYLD